MPISIPILRSEPTMLSELRHSDRLDDHPDLANLDIYFYLFDALEAVPAQTIATIWAHGKPEVYRAARLWCSWRGHRLAEDGPNERKAGHSAWLYRGSTFNVIVTIRLDNPDDKQADALPESRL